MEKDKIDALVIRFNDGTLSAAEMADLEKLIEQGVVDLTQLKDITLLDQHLVKVDMGRPSMRLDEQFHKMLASGKRQYEGKSVSFTIDWNNQFPRLALAASLLIAGFVGGYFLKGPSQDNSVKELTQQVGELKEMMMLTMLEKESATERLKAVSLTSDMQQVSKKVTTALFKTLNGDENVNVRLAALDVLMNYAKDGEVRAELIKSISLQDSPLVQIALADLMVTLQEKKSITELKKLLQSDKTPKEVKGKIKKSIDVLI